MRKSMNDVVWRIGPQEPSQTGSSQSIAAHRKQLSLAVGRAFAFIIISDLTQSVTLSSPYSAPHNVLM